MTINHNNFSSETTYAVYIGAITDLYGNQLAEGDLPNPWGFISADVISPEVTSFSPEDESIGIPQDQQIVINFDEYIDSNEFSFTLSPNPGLTGISWNSANTKVTLSFNNFEEDTEYEFKLLKIVPNCNDCNDCNGMRAYVFIFFLSNHTPVSTK